MHHFQYKDGQLFCENVSVASLVKKYGTPLFVMDEQDFRARCREHAEAFGDPTLVHYASKAFLSVQVAKWVAEEGLSIDVCTSNGGDMFCTMRTAIGCQRGLDNAEAEASGVNASSRDELGPTDRTEMGAGDVFVVETPGGGGYGAA